MRINADLPGQANLLGLQTGLANFNLAPNLFVPGAMADSMTSFGGIIFGPNGQTTLLAFIHAGAAGSYVTVTEPSTAVDKFPDPQNYFYQSRGFSLAECYYQSLTVPYQGLIVGEPLAAPWRQLATGSWIGLASNAVISGTAQLTVNFSAADASHPLNQIDLFVDGKFYRTLTNLPPQPGNVLNLNLRNQALSYVVPASATLASVASVITPGLAWSSIGTAGSLTTFLTASCPVALDSTAAGIRGFSVSGSIQVGAWLRIVVTPTNGIPVTLAVTNQLISGTPETLATDLVNLINGTPGLQGPSGLIVEDLTPGFPGSVVFNLLARSPGRKAVTLRVAMTSSGSLVINPAGEVTLTGNLSDLQPRNHLYGSYHTRRFRGGLS